MSSSYTLATDGKTDYTIFISSNAGSIERNAANMLSSEIKEKSGISIAIKEDDSLVETGLPALIISKASGSFVPGLFNGVKIEHEDGFAIRTTAASDGFITAAVGKTGSGILYAIDHILDNLNYTSGNVSIADLNIEDEPDSDIRGATFVSHAYTRYVDDPDDLVSMKGLIRSYARNRVNCITIEAAGRRWPGDLSPIVTWKYFPKLQDPARLGKVTTFRESVNELIDYAHSWGVKVVLFTSEFNHDPDIYERCPELHGVLPETWCEGRHNYIRGCICLSKDIAWQYWHAKVKEAIEALPNLDGLELWTAEVPSEFGICACPDCRKLERHEWMEKFYNATRQAIDEAKPGMELYIKTFQSSQGSLEVERFNPLKGKLPENSTVCTKAQFGDMAYLNDPHPLLGWIQDGNEATEFDVGGEYRGCGLGAMICCIPEYIADRIRLYHSRGVRKFLARHALPNWPNKDLLDINDAAFYKLAWNVNTNIDIIWHEWAEDRFGKEAAHQMVELLKMTDEVVNKSIYVRSACANRHYFIFSDNLDSFRYMMVDLSAMMIDGGLERIQPTPENIQAIVTEKEEAVELASEMLRKFYEVSDLLDVDMRDRLEAIFKRTERIVVIMRCLVEAVFNYFRYERSFSVRERDLMRPEILRMVNKCEAEIDEAQLLGFERADPNAPFGIVKVLDFERPRRMCEEIRGLVNMRLGQKGDYTVTVTPATVGHPNTYSEHRRMLREVFGLPGNG